MIAVVQESTNDLRGTWHAKIEIFNVAQSPKEFFYWGDRYYFDLDNAASEIELWLVANKQVSR